MEGIISHLISSISSTLHSQLINIVTNHVLSNSESPQHSGGVFPSLTNLPVIWKSVLATQVIILATQIALEIGLNQAMQGSDPAKLIKKFLEEITSLTDSAVTLLKGKLLQEDDVTQLYISDVPQLSTVQDQDNFTPTQENIVETLKPSRAYLVPRSHIRKMEDIVLILSSYRYKAEKLHLVLPTEQNISTSFHWQSLLHYEWSTHDTQVTISTIGASLSYGYHYSGSAARLVLTPVMERSLCVLLEAVKQGNSTLIVGKEVNVFF